MKYSIKFCHGIWIATDGYHAAASTHPVLAGFRLEALQGTLNELYNRRLNDRQNTLAQMQQNAYSEYGGYNPFLL